MALRRRIGNPVDVEINKVITPMLDMAFQIFAFFIVIYHPRSEEHTSELQSHHDIVCRLLPEKKNSPGRGDRWQADGRWTARPRPSALVARCVSERASRPTGRPHPPPSAGRQSCSPPGLVQHH